MPRRVLQGIVTSDVNEKTVTVEVQRRFTHPVYKTGEAIKIVECATKSKLKTWEVLPKASA